MLGFLEREVQHIWMAAMCHMADQKAANRDVNHPPRGQREGTRGEGTRGEGTRGESARGEGTRGEGWLVSSSSPVREIHCPLDRNQTKKATEGLCGAVVSACQLRTHSTPSS